MQAEENFNNFFQAHHRRVHYQIHRLGINGEWYELFYQEGIIALWKAYDAHDAKKGDIGTYLNYTIRYRLLDLLRKKMREQSKTEKLKNESKHLVDDGNRHRATEKTVIKYSGIIIEDTVFWDTVKSYLNENQWKWIQYFIIAELSIKEIMEIENVTADTVKNWGRAVRKKLNKTNIKQQLFNIYNEE